MRLCRNSVLRHSLLIRDAMYDSNSINDEWRYDFVRLLVDNNFFGF